MSTTQPPIVVTESSGAQVLPNVNDERATVTSWAAHIACDADLRTSNPIWQGIASRLVVKVASA